MSKLKYNFSNIKHTNPYIKRNRFEYLQYIVDNDDNVDAVPNILCYAGVDWKYIFGHAYMYDKGHRIKYNTNFNQYSDSNSLITNDSNNIYKFESHVDEFGSPLLRWESTLLDVEHDAWSSTISGLMEGECIAVTPQGLKFSHKNGNQDPEYKIFDQCKNRVADCLNVFIYALNFYRNKSYKYTGSFEKSLNILYDISSKFYESAISQGYINKLPIVVNKQDFSITLNGNTYDIRGTYYITLKDYLAYITLPLKYLLGAYDGLPVLMVGKDENPVSDEYIFKRTIEQFDDATIGVYNIMSKYQNRIVNIESYDNGDYIKFDMHVHYGDILYQFVDDDDKETELDQVSFNGVLFTRDVLLCDLGWFVVYKIQSYGLITVDVEHEMSTYLNYLPASTLYKCVPSLMYRRKFDSLLLNDSQLNDEFELVYNDVDIFKHKKNVLKKELSQVIINDNTYLSDNPLTYVDTIYSMNVSVNKLSNHSMRLDCKDSTYSNAYIIANYGNGEYILDNEEPNIKDLKFIWFDISKKDYSDKSVSYDIVSPGKNIKIAAQTSPLLVRSDSLSDDENKNTTIYTRVIRNEWVKRSCASAVNEYNNELNEARYEGRFKDVDEDCEFEGQIATLYYIAGDTTIEGNIVKVQLPVLLIYNQSTTAPYNITYSKGLIWYSNEWHTFSRNEATIFPVTLINVSVRVDRNFYRISCPYEFQEDDYYPRQYSIDAVDLDGNRKSFRMGDGTLIELQQFREYSDSLYWFDKIDVIQSGEIVTTGSSTLEISVMGALRRNDFSKLELNFVPFDETSTGLVISYKNNDVVFFSNSIGNVRYKELPKQPSYYDLSSRKFDWSEGVSSFLFKLYLESTNLAPVFADLIAPRVEDISSTLMAAAMDTNRGHNQRGVLNALSKLERILTQPIKKLSSKVLPKLKASKIKMLKQDDNDTIYDDTIVDGIEERIDSLADHIGEVLYYYHNEFLHKVLITEENVEELTSQIIINSIPDFMLQSDFNVDAENGLNVVSVPMMLPDELEVKFSTDINLVNSDILYDIPVLIDQEKANIADLIAYYNLAAEEDSEELMEMTANTIRAYNDKLIELYQSYHEQQVVSDLLEVVDNAIAEGEEDLTRIESLVNGAIESNEKTIEAYGNITNDLIEGGSIQVKHLAGVLKESERSAAATVLDKVQSVYNKFGTLKTTASLKVSNLLDNFSNIKSGDITSLISMLGVKIKNKNISGWSDAREYTDASSLALAMDVNYPDMSFVGRAVGFVFNLIKGTVNKAIDSIEGLITVATEDGVSYEIRNSGYETIDIPQYSVVYSSEEMQHTYPTIFKYMDEYGKSNELDYFTLVFQTNTVIHFITNYYNDKYVIRSNYLIEYSDQRVDYSLNDYKFFMQIYNSIVKGVTDYNTAVSKFNEIKQYIHGHHNISFASKTGISSIVDSNTNLPTMSFPKYEDVYDKYFSQVYCYKSETASTVGKAVGLCAIVTGFFLCVSGIGVGAGIAVMAAGAATYAVSDAAKDSTSNRDYSKERVIDEMLKNPTFANKNVSSMNLVGLWKEAPVDFVDFYLSLSDVSLLTGYMHTGLGKYLPDGRFIPMAMHNAEPPIKYHIYTDQERADITRRALGLVIAATGAIMYKVFGVASKVRAKRKYLKYSAKQWSLDENDPKYEKKMKKYIKRADKASAALDKTDSGSLLGTIFRANDPEETSNDRITTENMSNNIDQFKIETDAYLRDLNERINKLEKRLG